MNNNIFVFTQGDKCRYKLEENNKIIKCDNNDGNIVGIYYFHNYKNFILNDDCYNNDIVNYLEKIGYKSTENFKDADLIFFNTCSVKQKAEDKVLGQMNNMDKIIKNVIKETIIDKSI
jgi:hypothetical protein